MKNNSDVKPFITLSRFILLGILLDCGQFSNTLAGDLFQDALARGTPVLTAYSSPWDMQRNCTPGPTRAIMNNGWTSTRFDTDGEPGGCEFFFFVTDPPGDIDLFPLALLTDFQPMPGAGPNECRNTGRREIPITPQGFGATHMILDTDNNPGGCNLTFIVLNRNDIGLDIKYYPDDTGVDQCVNRTGPGQFHTATVNNPVTIGLNLDNRYGGCILELRLRKLAPLAKPSVDTPPAVSAPTFGGQFVSPQNGAKIRGIVSLEVRTMGSAPIASVQMAIDGNTAFCKIEMKAPYTCNWDSRKVQNGSHVLTAVVRDKANNTTSTPPVTVTVQNKR